MQKILRGVVVVLVLALALPSMALAQEAAADADAEAKKTKRLMNSIAVINVERVLKQSKAMQSIAKQMDGYRTAFETEIRAEQDRLRNAKAELDKQATLLDPTVLDQRRADFRKDVATYEQSAQAKLRALEEVNIEAVQQVRTALGEVIKNFVLVNHIGLVVNETAVVFVVSELDGTGIVLELLDKQLSSVTVAKPKPAAAQAQ